MRLRVVRVVGLGQQGDALGLGCFRHRRGAVTSSQWETSFGTRANNFAFILEHDSMTFLDDSTLSSSLRLQLNLYRC